MKKLVTVLTMLKKALKTLKNSFKVLGEAKLMNNEGILLATEDSVIQRFEYCFDMFWKFLSLYIATTFDIRDAKTPRKVFYVLVKEGLCSEEDGDILVTMVSDKNVASHGHTVELSREILPRVNRYYELMQSIVEKLSEDSSQ